MSDGYDYQKIALGRNDEYTHFQSTDVFGGQITVNGRTIAMLDAADGRLPFDLAIEQGSYSTAVSASGGTHAGGGVIDVDTSHLTDAQVNETVRVLREVGFAAWYRDTGQFANEKHIHAVSIGDTDLSSQAAEQVVAYRAGGNGLDGGPDTGPHVAIHPFDYAAYLQNPGSAGLGSHVTDAFGADPGTPIMQANQDDDGLTDEFERLLGTDPTKADTDGDGLSDVQETTVTHTNPLVANSPAEVAALLAHPGTAAVHEARIPIAALKAGFGGGATLDSDHDGLSDLTEVQLGSNPYDADTDHDGVSDGVEYRLGSSLVSNDTDHDGIIDGAELEQGTLGPTPDLGGPGGSSVDPVH